MACFEKRNGRNSSCGTGHSSHEHRHNNHRSHRNEGQCNSFQGHRLPSKQGFCGSAPVQSCGSQLTNQVDLETPYSTAQLIDNGNITINKDGQIEFSASVPAGYNAPAITYATIDKGMEYSSSLSKLETGNQSKVGAKLNGCYDITGEVSLNDPSRRNVRVVLGDKTERLAITLQSPTNGNSNRYIINRTEIEKHFKDKLNSAPALADEPRTDTPKSDTPADTAPVQTAPPEIVGPPSTTPPVVTPPVTTPPTTEPAPERGLLGSLWDLFTKPREGATTTTPPVEGGAGAPTETDSGMPDPSLSTPPVTDSGMPDPSLSTPPVTDSGMPDPALSTPPVTDAGMPDPSLSIPPVTDSGMPDPSLSTPPVTDSGMPDPSLSTPPVTDSGMPDPSLSTPPVTDSGMPDSSLSTPPVTDSGIPDPLESTPRVSIQSTENLEEVALRVLKETPVDSARDVTASVRKEEDIEYYVTANSTVISYNPDTKILSAYELTADSSAMKRLDTYANVDREALKSHINSYSDVRQESGMPSPDASRDTSSDNPIVIPGVDTSIDTPDLSSGNSLRPFVPGDNKKVIQAVIDAQGKKELQAGFYPEERINGTRGEKGNIDPAGLTAKLGDKETYIFAKSRGTGDATEAGYLVLNSFGGRGDRALQAYRRATKDGEITFGQWEKSDKPTGFFRHKGDQLMVKSMIRSDGSVLFSTADESKQVVIYPQASIKVKDAKGDYAISWHEKEING